MIAAAPQARSLHSICELARLMSRKIVLSAAAQAVQAQETCQPVGVQPANPHHAGCDRGDDQS